MDFRSESISLSVAFNSAFNSFRSSDWMACRSVSPYYYRYLAKYSSTSLSATAKESYFLFECSYYFFGWRVFDFAASFKGRGEHFLKCEFDKGVLAI